MRLSSTLPLRSGRLSTTSARPRSGRRRGGPPCRLYPPRRDLDAKDHIHRQHATPHRLPPIVGRREDGTRGVGRGFRQQQQGPGLRTRRTGRVASAHGDPGCWHGRRLYATGTPKIPMPRTRTASYTVLPLRKRCGCSITMVSSSAAMPEFTGSLYGCRSFDLRFCRGGASARRRHRVVCAGGER